MFVKRFYIILVLSVLCAGFAYSQPGHEEFCMDFRIGEVGSNLLDEVNTVNVSETIFPMLIMHNNRMYKADSVTVSCTSLSKDSIRCRRRLHLKTNVLGLGMGIANLGIEVDMAKHWSFTLPVFYSAWDYFTSTIKFRTLSVQPEVRYWFSPRNNGFFAGAHFGYGYYNLALDGAHRFQDHNRETPAIGGGLSIGYRVPMSRNKKWNVEFSVGAGMYDLHFDKFHNTSNTKDGLMVESGIRKTYLGVDMAAVSFVYSINLWKGGKR